MIIIVMGVSGAGKTTVGGQLASSLGWEFVDADSFHSPTNIEKMHRGMPLTDEDRAPWLEAIGEAVETWAQARQNVVLACSALKQAYRETITRGSPEVRLVYLSGSFEVIQERLARRTGHYMAASLLRSQFQTLEVPQDAVVVGIEAPPEEIVRKVRQGLSLPESGKIA